MNWTLSGEDRRRIERAGDWLATYRAVSYDEYRGTGPQARGPAESQAIGNHLARIPGSASTPA